MNFSVEIKTPAALSALEIQAWSAFRQGNPQLYSPYFHLEYVQIMGELREDAHILIVKDGDAPIAFLPFQGRLHTNGGVGFARPIGSPMTDYQGIICKPGTTIDVLQLMKRAGFGAFSFSALIDQDIDLNNYARSRTPCCVADISQGAEAWRAGRDSSYRRHLKSHRRRVRKSEELGAIRTELKSRDQHVFDQLIRWKRTKFRDTGKYDVLSADWTMALLEALWQKEESSGLRADMHALYFGDKLAAIDLGMTDGSTFHSWMVAYDNEFQHLAPGIQLLEKLIDAGKSLGYSRIDLGEGIDGYKRHYASEDVFVSSGFIAATGPAAALSKIYGAAEQFGERRLGNFGRLPGMARRRYAQIRACEPNFGGRAKAMLAAVAGFRK